MSRIAKAPITIPNNVDVKLEGDNIIVKGSKGQMSLGVKSCVNVEINDNVISVDWNKAIKNANAQAGTVRARINNMVEGVTKGFEKKLTLVGVGYRAQVSGKSLNLSLGFSHPVAYLMPEGITIEAPSQTEVIVKGMDKQQVGQVAAEIRAYRPPEPYKGKGVRYTDEYVARKAAKKK
ncbi:MAG: 50S ribosomal protein L6 [Methylococcales bacterium]|nr:50S ribosomal protein L6 [Methylococcales bacterium]